MGDVDPAEQRATVLLDRYERIARQELVAIGSKLLPELDSAAEVLRSALATQREIRVGFVGESQVGKSSLINAIVGRTALPTGGYGPLTAQATRLRYANGPRIEVRYHDRQRMNQFVFALRQYLAARGELEAETNAGESTESAGPWAHVGNVDPENGPAPANSEPGDLIKQARLMLGPGADALAPRTLHDAFRAVLGQPPLGPEQAFAAHDERIRDITTILGSILTAEERIVGAGQFADYLETNASGWRSPLVAELDLSLDVELLSRVEVVDLPGVGVVNDPAGTVAEEFVRNDAAALVIVARNNGLTDEVVGLLERTGVVTRLLFGGDESRVTPIHVIFAITRLDDVAQDHWKKERAAAKLSGTTPPTREEVFARSASEMARVTREQIRRTLESSQQFDDPSTAIYQRREQVVTKLCESIEIICVSAKDYANLQDEEYQNLAFLQNERATNIPHFRDRLAELAERARGSRRGRITRAIETFQSLLRSHLETLEASNIVPNRDAESDTFRAKLESSLPAFLDQATKLRTEVATFLAERIPPKLEELTNQASDRAHRHLVRFRKTGETLHWKSLNAALVRSGTYDRRAIDYPGTLTRSFVDVIAGSWEPSIIEEVRVVIRSFVKKQGALIEDFLDHASELAGGRLSIQVGAQKRLLREQGTATVDWTAEQLHDLSDDVQKRLTKIVGKPIQRACSRAVDEGKNRGPGARERILDAFQEGGQRAITDARASSLEILNDHVQRLRRSLGRVLRETDDPISQCYESIVQAGADHADSAAREERRVRAEAVARIRELVASEEVPPSSPRSVARVTISAPAPSNQSETAQSDDRSAANDIFQGFGT